MNPGSRKRKKNVQIFNKSALVRLAILFVLLFVLCIWTWLTMFRMPEKSYARQLPPLKDKEILLQDSLKQDLKKISVEIGSRNYSQHKNLDITRQFLENTLTILRTELGGNETISAHSVVGGVGFNQSWVKVKL
jgi:magnesium-transporting ATPase (P-type)